MECFRRSEAIGATECGSKSDGKAQVTGHLVGPEGSPRVGVPWRSHGAAGRFGGCWGWSSSYVRVELMDERAYGASGLGGQGGLRGAFRDGSGAGRRVALGYVQKRFSSCLYRAVLGGSAKAVGNLTDGLTTCLTPDLTGYLTDGLTKAGVREVQRGVRKPG